MPYTKVEIGLFTVDALWSLCVIYPILVVYWSGTWTLVDFYMDSLFPNQQFISASVSIIIGSGITMVAYFVLPLTKGLVAVSCKSLKHVVVSRISIYVCATGSLFFWRGVWNIAFTLMGNDLLPIMLTTVIALLLLILLKSSANPIGSLFVLHSDTREDFYDTYPRFRHKMDTLLFYTLDALFTIYVIVTLTVVVWVGLWKLGDALILPNDIKQSLIISLIAGFGCSVVILALWLPVYSALNRISASNRITALIIEATFNVVSVVVVLLLWRGLWGTIQRHLDKVSNSVEVAWTLHSVGFSAMICLQVGSTFGGVGCDVDGEWPFVDWPMEYFIVFYRTRQNEQHASRTIIQTYSEDEPEAVRPLVSSTRSSQQSLTQSSQP